MNTTLSRIKEKAPCTEGWAKLLKGLGKTQADDEPLSIVKIIDTNDFDDAMWAIQAVEGHDRELRLFASWCCDQIAHLITDDRSKNAVAVARKFANGEATEQERDAAWAAAWAAARAAAWAAAWDAARDAARDAAWAAAWDAARDAARDAAWDAMRSRQKTELIRVCECIERGEDPYPV